MMHNCTGLGSRPRTTMYCRLPLFTVCPNIWVDRISSVSNPSIPASQVSQILFKERMEKRKKPLALAIEILVKFKSAGKNSLPASQVYAALEFILYCKVSEAPLKNVHLIEHLVGSARSDSFPFSDTILCTLFFPCSSEHTICFTALNDVC